MGELCIKEETLAFFSNFVSRKTRVDEEGKGALEFNFMWEMDKMNFLHRLRL